MTLSSPDVEGITITGKHEDGIGNARIISDLNKVLSTHYYYQGESPAANCSNFLSGPLIYDYGGKPNPITPEMLDFFTDGGSGTGVLGTDCSGLVFSAVVTAGLRISPDKALEARSVMGINSGMFMAPDQNGLECFDYISVDGSQTIEPGDIAAISGHVLMVGKLGLDPLGVKSVPTKGACENITINNFSFEVWQSSPDHQGIGINRYEAKDWLQWGSTTMKNGFVNYAKQACRARFDGVAVKPRLTNFSIVRHKGSNSCRTARITLNKESCIKDCSQLFD
jgi:hypothetical protein